MFAEGLVLKSCRRSQFAANDFNIDALIAEDSQPPAACLPGRIITRDHHWPDTGSGNRIGAGWLLALMAVQGAMGWYMVASGLAERTTVSQCQIRMSVIRDPTKPRRLR